MSTILQINISANWGSTGKIAEQIGSLAIKAGYESHIAYGRIANNSESSLYRIESKLGTLWHGAYSLFFDRHCLSSSRATKNLISYIQELNPDIIHLHNIHGYYLNMKLLFEYLNSTRIPIVWTLHDCWAYTGHCSHYSNINCNKWQTECFNCPKYKNYPKSLFFDRSNKNFHLKKELFCNNNNLTLIPVSEWLGKEVSKSFLKNKNISVILNGVDTSIFHPFAEDRSIREKYGLGDCKILLAVASIWGPQKGLNDYIQLSKMLPTDTKLVMVGVDKKLKNKLPAEIITIKRTNNQEELAQLYSAADIVMNLSYLETFGMTTAEGFACGTPSIVYNCTASPELITSETGRVVNSGDLDSVLNNIFEITSIGKQRWINACRNRAVEKYDKSKNFGKYVRLYEELMSKQ